MNHFDQLMLEGCSPERNERMYLGWIIASDVIIKVGHSTEIAVRIRKHRQNGILVCASWVADLFEEQSFHNDHHEDSALGKREWYWPTRRVVDDVGMMLHDASLAGLLEVHRSKYIWQLPDVELELDRRMFVLQAHPELRRTA